MWTIIKRLIGELRPHRRLFIVMAIAGIVMSLAQWQLAMKLKDLFDALETKQISEIYKIPTMILGITFAMVLGRYIHLASMNYLADIVTMQYRHQLQWKFMTLNQSFHLQYQGGAGGLISRILSDVVSIQNGLRLVADFFTQPLAFILLLGTLLYRDSKLTLLIFIILPFLLLFLRSIGRSLRKYGHGSQEVLERVATIVKESLDGMRVIQSFGLENEMNRRFSIASKEYLENRRKIHIRGEITSPITELLATGIIMVIFVYIGVQITEGRATFGDFGSYLGALMMLQSPIKKFQESFIKIQETLVSLQRVYSIIDDESYVSEEMSSEHFPQNWKQISFHHVGFRYQNSQVLHDVNLNINRGEVIAIVGESGSGKSTLVNLLQRFFDPSVGEVQIDGVDIRKFRLKELRKNIGLVTQDVFLFSESVGRNIHSGDFSKPEEGITEAAMTANAHDFIVKMPYGYESSVGDKGGFLSGGERQRVSIARALFKNAPILILDEATSALDSASEVEVQKGLERLMLGKTTIVIAHRLSTVLHANRIIVMKDGRIIESGTHVELLSRGGEYSKFIALQNLK